MRYDFFPDREADMVAWGRAFVNGLRRQPGHFGVSEDDLIAMESYQQAFEIGYRIANTPATRTQGAVTEKNQMRKAMEKYARCLSMRLKGNVELTDEDRVNLGLNVPRPRRRKISAPGEAPVIKVMQITGADVTIQLGDANNRTSRARPDNAQSAMIMYCVGGQKTGEPDDWRYVTGTSRTQITLPFDPSLGAGTPVYIKAFWNSRQQEPGPESQPVRVCLGEGVKLPGRKYVGQFTLAAA